jgi:hypothetical protein
MKSPMNIRAAKDGLIVSPVFAPSTFSKLDDFRQMLAHQLQLG